MDFDKITSYWEAEITNEIKQHKLNDFLFLLKQKGVKVPKYLVIDGVLGKKTKEVDDLFCAYKHNVLAYKRGFEPIIIPVFTSQKKGESYFGGKNDKGDRTWGQANLIRKIDKPGDILEKYSKLLYLFDISLIFKNYDKFPIVTDEKGEEKPAGLSYFLNTNVNYCALPVVLSKRGFVNEDCLIVKLICSSSKRKALAIVTDYGPAKWTKCQLDLSPNLWKILEVEQDESFIEIKVANKEEQLYFYKKGKSVTYE